MGNEGSFAQGVSAHVLSAILARELAKLRRLDMNPTLLLRSSTWQRTPDDVLHARTWGSTFNRITVVSMPAARIRQR